MIEILYFILKIMALFIMTLGFLYILERTAPWFRLRNYIYRSIKKDGSRLCKNCNGTGWVDEIYGKMPCDVCEHTGKLDWVRSIMVD